MLFHVECANRDAHDAMQTGCATAQYANQALSEKKEGQKAIVQGGVCAGRAPVATFLPPKPMLLWWPQT
jgi:hypothetical protein